MAELKSVPSDEYVSELGEFEGRPVEAIRLVVERTGSGLDKTMRIKPGILEIGDMTGILILGEAGKIRYEPHKYDEGETDHHGLDRVQIVYAEGAVLMPEDSSALKAVRKMLVEIEKREKARRDAKRGQMTMAVDDIPDGGAEPALVGAGDEEEPGE